MEGCSVDILEIRNVSKSFGGLQAVRDVSLNIESGKITSLIGPNGAGKTTLFNLVTGFLKMDTGSVILDGKDITRLPAHRIVRKGLTRTFQMVRVYPRMTVTDNILMGFYGLAGDSLWSALAGTKKMYAAYYQKKELALAMVEYIGLSRYKDTLANDLSYGQQKLVELGRALVSQPKVLLLDEPLAGLNVVMIERMIQLIKDLKKQGKTVVIIEHNMEIVMGISDFIHVLNFGQLIASGNAEEILKHEKVIDSYLGKN
jgi:ABC-type branched-subunit amino acid transport system ATPase component